MFTINDVANNKQNYQHLLAAIDDLLAGETNIIANLANITAFINGYLTDFNWVGFYLLEADTLVLGPFQGGPACIRIPLDKGVCGAAASQRRVICVNDVNQFPGHIACDSASKSEIVLPIYQNEKIYGVLDIDSPLLNRFDADDEQYLTEIAAKISRFLSQS